MIVKIEEGTTILKKRSILVTEDLELYLPHSLTRMESGAIYAGWFKHYKVNVYYNGTMEEYKNILKGDCEKVVVHDEYGAYYHHAPEYEICLYFYNWYHYDSFDKPVINCLDGTFIENSDEVENKCRKIFLEENPNWDKD